MNNRGQIVGRYSNVTPIATDDSNVRAFLLDRGTLIDIQIPGATQIQPSGVNDRGQVVGFTCSDPLGTGARGFLLAMGAKGPATPIDFPGAPRTIAFDINNKGQIVGAHENTAAAPNGQRSPMPMMMSGG